jgi:hypothetical protein
MTMVVVVMIAIGGRVVLIIVSVLILRIGGARPLPIRPLEVVLVVARLVVVLFLFAARVGVVVVVVVLSSVAAARRVASTTAPAAVTVWREAVLEF